MKNLSNFFLICIVVIAIPGLFWGCEKEEKNTAPVADFTILPDSGDIETMFVFDASACSDGQSQVAALQVRWDWENDGFYDTDFSTNKLMNHQFTAAGTYQVTIEVKDPEGLGAVATKTLVVEGIIPTVTSDTVSSVGPNSAICGGEVVSENGSPVIRRGVCWGTSPLPDLEGDHSNDGEGTGHFTSEITGLTKNTTYYARAYATNSTGTSYGEERTFTTKNVFVCGEPLSISHVAGDVAPVSKNIIYGTVTNISGEPGLCWITSNLGADHQAVSVDDATEPSAGWYWQFNRKRGFKYDGVSRIPAEGWESSIEENSNWMLANDPCSIELGEGWRVPSQSEWWNVEQWTDWNGAWESPLKLHAAGFFFYDDTFHDRGVQGIYWSNLAGADGAAWYMRFKIDESVCSANQKEVAVTIRCVKE